MKNTNRLLFALLAAAALVFAAGCSDSDDSGSSSTYNGDSDYYGTYSASSSGVSYTFTFTSTSWSYTTIASTVGVGTTVSGSTWEYSGGYIYCYADGVSDGVSEFYVLTVNSTRSLSFQGTTLTKSSQ